MTITLNTQQQQLIQELLAFYFDPKRKVFVLSGQAGVGKTTCVKHFIQQLRASTSDRITICVAGPTNKSVKVLSESTNLPEVTYKTIYSILGLRMMANGEFKELTDGGQCRVGDFDLVVCDEGSMVGSVLLDYVEKKTRLADTKIVFIGDNQQLPPVGEEDSPIWRRYGTQFSLTEVMRHQNSILTFVQSIRGNPAPVIESPGNEVRILDENMFLLGIRKYAEKGYFHSGDAKAIAWRNMTVEWLNGYIRDNNELTKGGVKFVVGDRVVIKEPIIVGETTLAATDDEGEVLSAKVAAHRTYAHIKAWHLTIAIDGGETISAYCVHESSVGAYEKMLHDLKEKKMWKEFWRIKEAFHNVGYAYAFTAHRSQGSTVKHVFVDAGDICLNRKDDERMKCLYVACSRASQKLFVFP